MQPEKLLLKPVELGLRGAATVSEGLGFLGKQLGTAGRYAQHLYTGAPMGTFGETPKEQTAEDQRLIQLNAQRQTDALSDKLAGITDKVAELKERDEWPDRPIVKSWDPEKARLSQRGDLPPEVYSQMEADVRQHGRVRPMTDDEYQGWLTAQGEQLLQEKSELEQQMSDLAPYLPDAPWSIRRY
jgi:hypothetical protein